MESKSTKNKERLKELEDSLRTAYSEKRKFPESDLQEALKLAYKNTGNFYYDEEVDDSDYSRIVKDIWEACVYCAENFLPFIVFSNDVLKVPPTKTFLDIYQKMYEGNNINFKNRKHSQAPKNYQEEIKTGKYEFEEATIARKIGAFWGFIFQNILPYERYPKNVRIGTLGVKTASRFELRNIDCIENAERLKPAEYLIPKRNEKEGEGTK